MFCQTFFLVGSKIISTTCSLVKSGKSFPFEPALAASSSPALRCLERDKVCPAPFASVDILLRKFSTDIPLNSEPKALSNILL